MAKQPNYEEMTLDELDEVKSHLFAEEKKIADQRKEISVIYKKKVTEKNEANRREPKPGDVTVSLGGNS